MGGSELVKVRADRFRATIMAHEGSVLFVKRYANVFIEQFNLSDEDLDCDDLLMNSIDYARYMLGRAAKRTLDAITKEDLAARGYSHTEDQDGDFPTRRIATFRRRQRGSVESVQSAGMRNSLASMEAPVFGKRESLMSMISKHTSFRASVTSFRPSMTVLRSSVTRSSVTFT